MFKNIETPRLSISPMHITDAAFILELVNTESWKKYIGDRKINNIKGSEQYILEILRHPNYFYHIFELKQSKQPIGVVTFLYRATYDCPDIGFAILPNFEKCGYTFEASRAYLDSVLENKSIKKVAGITLPENKNAISLLQNLGLRYKEIITHAEEQLLLFEITNE